MKTPLVAVFLLVLEATSVFAACPPGEVQFLGACLPGYRQPTPHLPAIAKPAPVIATPMPPSLSPPSYGSKPLNFASLIPVRAYLRASDIPPPGIAAYGIVALHGRPTQVTKSRLIMACNAFLAYLPKQSELPPTILISNQMLTIWPVDNPNEPDVEADKCDYILDHYSLYAAESAMQDAELQRGNFRGQGPFLIGWSPTDTRGKPDKFVLVVDMSSFNSQDSFDQGFRFWKEKIVENPALWRSGWSVNQTRLAIKEFADRYGSDIMKAAHLSD